MITYTNTLNAPDFVLSIIEHGYAVSIGDFPTSCHFNNSSTFKHPAFVSYALEELLENKRPFAVRGHVTTPTVNLLAVSKCCSEMERIPVSPALRKTPICCSRETVEARSRP